MTDEKQETVAAILAEGRDGRYCDSAGLLTITRLLEFCSRIEAALKRRDAALLENVTKLLGARGCGCCGDTEEMDEAAARIRAIVSEGE